MTNNLNKTTKITQSIIGLLIMLFVISFSNVSFAKNSLSAKDTCPIEHIGECTKAHINIAAYAVWSLDSTEEHWKPTIDKLRHDLPQYHINFKVLNEQQIQDALKRKEIHFLIAPLLRLSVTQRQYPFKFIAAAKSTFNPDNLLLSDGVALIVSADSPARKISDLEKYTLWEINKNDPSTLGGLKYHLIKKNDDIANHFSDIRYTGAFPDSVFRQIKNSTSAAGILSICTFEDFVKQGIINKEDFRVLEDKKTPQMPCSVTTELFPGWGMIGQAKLPQHVLEKVRLSLLTIKPDPKTLSQTMFAGWALTPLQSEINDFHKVIGSANASPLKQIFQWLVKNQFWGWFFLLIIIFWFFYHAHLQMRFAQAQKDILQLQAEINEKRVNLETRRVSSLLGELGTSLAHELNQPLESVINYAHAVSYRASKIPEAESLIQPLKMIENEALRASKVIKRLRNMVKDDKRVELKLTNPFEIVTETLQIFQNGFTQANVRIHHKKRGDETIKAMIDAVGFQQVLVNIFKNAIEVFNDNHTRFPTLEIHEVLSNGLYTLVVTDNGPGLSNKFEESFRAFHTTKIDGIGLGLPLCRQTTEELGGKFSIRNVDGPETGARVTVAIPFAPKSKDQQ